MSTHTPDSRRRRATPRQIARAVRRGSIPANFRPRPPMPHAPEPAPAPAPARARTALSVEQVEEREPVDAPDAIAGAFEEDETARRWGPALFLQRDGADAGRDGFGWMANLRERLPRRSPYSWRERDWRSDAWAARIRMLPAIAGILLALIVVGAFAYVIAMHAAGGAASRLHSVSGSSTTAPASSPGGVIIQQHPGGAPTPAAPTYTIGAWVTDYGPASGGSETVFVRVSKDANPVAHVAVSLSISWSTGGSSAGPTLTDSYGLATFHVSVSARPGDPEFVTASVTVGGSTITANTTFVPAGGGANPSSNIPTYAIGNTPYTPPPITLP